MKIKRGGLTTACEVVGAFVASLGVALVYYPAGVIAAGFVLIGVGYLEGRRTR